MKEADAIAQLKAGNIAGLKVLMDIYQVQAVQAAFLITRERAMAEDIVQNAYLRSYERIRQFDDSRPFRPWFLRIVINDALKVADNQMHNVSLDEDEVYQKLIDKLESTVDEPEDNVQRNELREAIIEALHKLSPRQRAVIVQRYYLGFSEREMSNELDCSPGTIKWHLNTARKRLRALLLPFVE